MNYNRNKMRNILIIISIIIACSSLIIIYLVVNNNNNKIYNRWNYISSELSKDGNVTSKTGIYENDNYPYIEIGKEKINICYYEDEYVCQKVNYKLSGKKLFVEQNDTFLSGNFIIKLRNDELIITTENDGSNILIATKYKRGK